MADRMVTEAFWGYQSFVLKSAVVAERGKLACWDTADGALVKGAVAATLVPVGIFMNSLTGDGVKTVLVQLFKEIRGIWWDNDTVAPVTAAMRGQICFIKDDQTVTSDDTGASALGMVMAVDTIKGVLVHSDYPFVPGA